MRRNKFGARKTPCAQGHNHASKREAGRCNDLHILERKGEIAALQVEPQFWFVIDGKQVKHANGRRVGYKPDFAYIEPGLKDVVEEVKGMVVRDFPLRAAIFRALFPEFELRIIT